MKIPQPHLPRGRRSWLVAGLVVVGVVLLVVALVVPDGRLSITKDPESADTTAIEEGEELDTPAKGPDEIIVPSVDIEAPIVPIEIDPAGVLTPPADTDIVGWWQRSAEPGSGKGQTVVTGHTVSSGGGVMNTLGEVDIGALVRVRDEGKLIDYRVTGVFKLSREEVADAAENLFGQGTQGGRLVMVTCTDYVDGDYESNIIVWAEPLEGQKKSGGRAA